MNLRSSASLLAGAALIHIVLTACSENAGVATAGADAGASNQVEVSVEECSKSFQVEPPPGSPGGQATTIRYAEHAYPGRSKFDLSGRVTNWTEIAGSPSSTLRPTGYELEPQLVLYVKDGFVGAPCVGNATSTTFVYTP
jgi:hypothetical protein